MKRRDALGFLISATAAVALSGAAQALPAMSPKDISVSDEATGLQKSWWRRRWGWRRRWRRW